MTRIDTKKLPILPLVSSLTAAHQRSARSLVQAAGLGLARAGGMATASPLRLTASLVLFASFLAAGSGACSYAFVDGPPEKHRQLPYFTCTTSKAWPVVDTVLAGVYAVDTAAFLSAGSSSTARERETVAITAAGLAVLFAASAVSGYGKASDCREATEELQVRLIRMQQQAAPGFGPGPQSASPYQPPSPYDPWVTSPAGAPPPPPPPAKGAPTPESNSPPAPKH